MFSARYKMYCEIFNMIPQDLVLFKERILTNWKDLLINPEIILDNVLLYWRHNNYYKLEAQEQVRQSIPKIWFLKFWCIPFIRRVGEWDSLNLRNGFPQIVVGPTYFSFQIQINIGMGRKGNHSLSFDFSGIYWTCHKS